MGLMLALKNRDAVKVGSVTITVAEIKGKRVRLHFDGPDKINRLGNQGTLVPQTKEK